MPKNDTIVMLLVLNLQNVPVYDFSVLKDDENIERTAFCVCKGVLNVLNTKYVLLIKRNVYFKSIDINIKYM